MRELRIGIQGKLMGIISLITLVALLIVAFTVMTLAEMDGDAVGVNISGRQRMLSQKMSKEALAISAGINEEANRASLGKTHALFQKSHSGLIKGDAALGLAPTTAPDTLRQMSVVDSIWKDFSTHVLTVIDAPSGSEASAASVQYILQNNVELLSEMNKAVSLYEKNSRAALGSLKNVLWGGALLVIAITVLISLLIRRFITAPIGTIERVLQELSAGDLGVRVQHDSGDEIGGLAMSINTMAGSFGRLIEGIVASASNVVGAVEMLRNMAGMAEDGALKQSGQASLIATASEEMSQTITDIARNASFASDTSTQAMETANEGKETAEGAVQMVNVVFTSTVELATMVEKLNKRVGEIGDIVTVINEIADQTSLLALNAAIEAARAGEQGRGFAVVADEVKKLAERTIKATQEISGKIEAVQVESTETAKSMDGATGEVTKAAAYIKKVGSSLNSIVSSVQDVRDQAVQIAVAVEQQSAASEEVTGNIEQTSRIANEMEKMSKDVMAEVGTLSNVAEGLRNSVSGFKGCSLN